MARGIVRWTDEAIIKAIQQFNEKHGRPPTANELASGGASAHDMPSPHTMDRAFGSFSNAIVEAGFEPRPKGWSKDDETEKLRERVIAGETLTAVADSIGITSQSLGRRIRRFEQFYRLEPIVLKPGRRKVGSQ